MLYKDVTQIFHEGKDNIININEKKDKNKITEKNMLLNTRNESLYYPDSVVCLIDKENAYILPATEIKKYYKKGKIIKKPDEVFLVENWFITGNTEESLELVDKQSEKYVVNENLPIQKGDDPITILAKDIINEVSPFIVNLTGKTNKRWIRDRINNIKKNSISPKMFIQLCNNLNLHVKMEVYSDDPDVFDGGTFERKLI